MNRRSFLLSIGMLSCSSTAGTSGTKGGRQRTHSAKRATSETNADRGVVDTVWFDSQLRASPLALRGDTLVQSVEGELRSWDATTMQRKDTWTLPHRHFCFVQDGTLVAFGWPKRGSSTSVIHRISAGKVRSSEGPLVPSSNTIAVLPASTPDELYVVVEENIYRLVSSKVAEMLAHPAPHSATRDQWVSRGDGRLIGGRNGALYAVAPKGTSVDYPMSGRVLTHLVAGTGDRVWYSYADRKEDWNAHTLVLSVVDKPMEAVRTLDVAPARVVHAASFGDTVAALVFTGRSHDDVEWNVAVFDETGRERWRVKVPAEIGPGAGLNHAFVAIGEQRVVLASFDGRLLAWDAADGKPVG